MANNNNKVSSLILGVGGGGMGRKERVKIEQKWRMDRERGLGKTTMGVYL